MRRSTTPIAKTRIKPALGLNKLQREIFSGLSNPLTRKQRSRAKLANGRSFVALAEKYVRPNQQLSAAERLEIYNRQYWFRLIDCLYSDFPGLRALVGEDRFYNLIVAYLRKFPSRSFTLRDLGQHLPDFLAANPRHLGARKLVGLQMARFELAQIEAFDGPSKPGIQLESWQGLDPQKLRFGLQPHLTLLELDYALDDFAIALRKEAKQLTEASMPPGRKPVATKSSLLPARRRVHLAVHRYNNMIFYKRLEPAAFNLLTRLAAGLTLGEALQLLPLSLQRSKSLGSQLEAWFKSWSALGWFTSTK